MKKLNFEELHEWHIKNESVLMSRSERHEAKQKELKNWIDRDVYEEENKDSFIKNRFTNNF